MDFDGDDPLDDLLRDTSADKFKTSITTLPPTDVVTPNPSGTENRKERKSALLAELFGGGPSTSGFTLSDIRDQDSSTSKPNTSLSETFVRSDIGIEKPVSSSFLSSGSKIFGDFTEEKRIDSLNFSPARASHSEFTEKKDSDVSLGSYVPSIGKSPVVQPIPGSKSRPSSSPNSLSAQLPNTSPARLFDSANQSRDVERISTLTFTPKVEQNTEVFPSPTTQPRSIFKEEKTSIFTPPAQNARQEIPQQSSYPPVIQPVQSVQLDTAVISGFKESIEKFSDSFFSRLEALSERVSSVGEISCGLNELQKCLLSISQCLVTSSVQPDRAQLKADVEKRLLSMESRLETLQQENTTLRARLETVENQLRDYKSESLRTKPEIEASVESQLKPLKELVNNLDSKVNVQSSLVQSATNETNQTLRNLENLHSKIQERMNEVERWQSEKASKGYSEEIQLLLKNELKWLRQEKDKLKKNRKENQLGFQGVHGKLNLLDRFAMVSNTSYFIQITFKHD